MPTPYHGRHRRPLPLRPHSGAPWTPRRASTLVGAGLVVPAVAVALSAAGVGRTDSATLLDGAMLAAMQQESSTLVADQRERLETRTGETSNATRLVLDRASRTQERTRVSAVESEESRRAAQEAARDAAAPVEITSAAAAGVGGAGPGDAGSAATGQVAAGAQSPGEDHRWTSPFTAGYVKTSSYGMRWGSMHPAQDFAMPVGSPVAALSSGTVVFAGWQGGYGNKVEIQYWDGTTTWYCHNSALKVSQGDHVSPGQVVSLSGNTGHSTGPHVHLEVHVGGGSTVPPLSWLADKGINL